MWSVECRVWSLRDLWRQDLTQFWSEEEVRASVSLLCFSDLLVDPQNMSLSFYYSCCKRSLVLEIIKLHLFGPIQLSSKMTYIQPVRSSELLWRKKWLAEGGNTRNKATNTLTQCTIQHLNYSAFFLITKKKFIYGRIMWNKNKHMNFRHLTS